MNGLTRFLLSLSTLMWTNRQGNGLARTQRGKKTLLSLTLVWICTETLEVQNKWETQVETWDTTIPFVSVLYSVKVRRLTKTLTKSGDVGVYWLRLELDDSSRVHFGVRRVQESLLACRTLFPLPLTIEDTFRWGVWLGRYICQTITQVSQGQLNENGNLV